MVRYISSRFTITIKKKAESYTIEANGKKGIRVDPQPSDELNNLLSDEQIKATIKDLANEQGSATSDAIKKLGYALYNAIFIKPIILAFGKAQGSIKNDQGVCLKLRIEPPELAALPWETLYDGQDWLSTQSKTPLVRQLILEPGSKTLQKLQVRGALKILFVGASPEDLPNLEIEKTATELKELLEESINKKKIIFNVILNATFKELQEELIKDYHILYFAGHGSPESIFLDDGQGDDIKEGEKVVGRGRGDKYSVSAEILAKALEGKQTRLVFLAACETSKTSDESGLLRGFAQELAQRSELPAIVAMQYFISDKQANPLTTQFFAALASGRPVDVALAEARKTLISKGKVGRDVFSPVLYLQAEDGRLFQKAKNWSLWALLVSMPILIILIYMYLVSQQISYAQKLQRDGLNKFENQPLEGLRLLIEAWTVMPKNKRPDIETSIKNSLQAKMKNGRLLNLGKNNIYESYYAERSGTLILDKEKATGDIYYIDSNSYKSLSGEIDQVIFEGNEQEYFLVYYAEEKVPTELRRTNNGEIIFSSKDIYRVAVSPDATCFLVEYFEYSGKEGELRCIDTGKVFPLSGRISISTKEYFSPKTTYLEIDYIDNTPTELRRTDTGDIISLKAELLDITFHPSNDTCFLVEYFGEISDEWHCVDAGKVIPLSGKVNTQKFSSGNTYIMISYRDEGVTSELRRTDTGDIIPLKNQFDDLVFHPKEDTCFLVKYSGDKNDEWRCLSTEEVIQFSGKVISERNKFDSDFSPMGTYLRVDYSDEKKSIELFNTQTGKFIEFSGYIENTSQVSFRQDELCFFAEYSSGNLGSELFCPHLEISEKFKTTESVIFNPNGNCLLIQYSTDRVDDLYCPNTNKYIQLAGKVRISYSFLDMNDSYFLDYQNSVTTELRNINSGAIIKFPNNAYLKANISNSPYFLVEYSGDFEKVDPDSLNRVQYKKHDQDNNTGKFVNFSAHKTEDFSQNDFFLREPNKKTELWHKVHGYKLIDLGLDLMNYHFDIKKKLLIVRYKNNQAYLLDLNWLEAMKGDPSKLSSRELLQVACLPFASGFFDTTKPQPRACQ